MRPLDDIDRVLAQLAARSHALHAARRSLAEVDGDRAHLESELERLSTASPVDAGDDAITRSLARLRALQTQREQIGATIAELSRADHELDSALVQKADAIRALARPDAGEVARVVQQLTAAHTRADALTDLLDRARYARQLFRDVVEALRSADHLDDLSILGGLTTLGLNVFSDPLKYREVKSARTMVERGEAAFVELRAIAQTQQPELLDTLGDMEPLHRVRRKLRRLGPLSLLVDMFAHASRHPAFTSGVDIRTSLALARDCAGRIERFERMLQKSSTEASRAPRLARTVAAAHSCCRARANERGGQCFDVKQSRICLDSARSRRSRSDITDLLRERSNAAMGDQEHADHSRRRADLGLRADRH